MTTPSQPSASSPDFSWPMLIGIAVAVIGPLCLLFPSTYYTDGEVMQGLFIMLGVILGLFIVLVALRRRRTAAWIIILLGGTLLLRQTGQILKWAQLQEEAVAIVHFAEETKRETGRYPTSLDGYVFKHAWVRSHVQEFTPLADDDFEFRFTYFLNDPGISYWYYPKTGFWYYPD
jgi:hypothetical protein